MLQVGMARNGFSIPKHGANRWVYVAVGVDAETRRAAAVARDAETGDLLASNINFYWNHDRLADDFPWELLAESVQGPVPQAITLRHESVSFRGLRLSDRFRDEVLMPQAEIPSEGMRTFEAMDLSASRVRTVVTDRWIGYPGYRNWVRAETLESFVPLSAGGEPIEIRLRDVSVGLYSFYLFGHIEPNGRDALERVWQPCPMEFEVRDASGRRVAYGKRLVKQGLSPRRLQGFHFHALEAGDYLVTFRLTPAAREVVRVQWVHWVDQLADLPDQPVKKRQTLVDSDGVDWKQLAELSASRKERDRLIWNGLPPLNVHLQVHQQVRQFRQPPTGSDPDWGFVANEQYKRGDSYATYYFHEQACTPLDLINRDTGEVLPASDGICSRLRMTLPWALVSTRSKPDLPSSVDS